MYKPVVLVILDGWGVGKSEKGNALAKAKLPTIAKLNEFYPHTALQASGISVGLPWEESGNSEVGHITLGSGKIVYQNLPRITMDIQTGEFFHNPVFLSAMESAKTNNSALHLMGLVGKGGVHSHLDHLYALLEFAKQQKVEKLFLHLFTDGRDSAPDSGVEVIQELQKRLVLNGLGKIATLGGRNFGMDRNDNWDRIQKAYDSMTKGTGVQITDPIQYLKDSYAKEIFDEFLEPAVLTENGAPVATIQDNDSVIFFNFREDRAREITKAFVLPDFKGFERPLLKNLHFATMVQYEDGLPVHVAFEPVNVKVPLGKILSQHELKQLRISETEKFAHVTYFFNGGSEETYPGEDRLIIPSLTVDSYVNAPQMKAKEITDEVIKAVQAEKYDFILINYPNADIVGHTGNEAATIQAAEAIDEALGRLVPAIVEKGGCLLMTADHGNAEELQNIRTGETNTEHSTNPVPVWFVTKDNHRQRNMFSPHGEEMQVEGLLSDIAPTVLELMGLPKAADMTGESLLSILK